MVYGWAYVRKEKLQMEHETISRNTNTRTKRELKPTILTYDILNRHFFIHNAFY